MIALLLIFFAVISGCLVINGLLTRLVSFVFRKFLNGLPLMQGGDKH